MFMGYDRRHTSSLRAISEAISMRRQSYIYILSNKGNTVLYIGVTSNLIRRIWQHKNKLADGFTKRYNIDKLVFYECCEDISEAIHREKQLKGGSRGKKELLINKRNPEWRDLYADIST